MEQYSEEVILQLVEDIESLDQLKELTRLIVKSRENLIVENDALKVLLDGYREQIELLSRTVQDAKVILARLKDYPELASYL